MFRVKDGEWGTLAWSCRTRRASGRDSRETTMVPYFKYRSKDLPGTHWLALYATQSGRIELFDSVGFSPSMYGLDSLDPLHLLYSLQSFSSSVCGHYCIVYIYLFFIIHHNVKFFICFYIS